MNKGSRLNQIKKVPDTSWQKVNKWYADLVGGKGSYYHEHLVLPGALKMLGELAKKSLLDLGCGEGILGRKVGKETSYTGIDLSPALIKIAKQKDPSPNHQYVIGDITKNLPSREKDFDSATCLLALQNVNDPELVIKQANLNLKKGGRLVLVINHPCFRIPRQSGWGVDEKQNSQYRRITSYLSPMKIPVTMNPSKGVSSPVTWTTHFSLQDLSGWLKKEGFVIEEIKEWVSDKKSMGGAASRENRSRVEIPLFMAIAARHNG